jgi:hypothetical protein
MLLLKFHLLHHQPLRLSEGSSSSASGKKHCKSTKLTSLKEKKDMKLNTAHQACEPKNPQGVMESFFD